MKYIQACLSAAGVALASSLVGCSSDTTTEYTSNSGSGSGPLEAGFSASAVRLTEGEPILFSDESTGAITKREWDFDGDDVPDSTDKNPIWVPDLGVPAFDKTFTVTLTLNDGAAEEIKANYIEVLAKPVASFTIDPGEGPVVSQKFTIENTSTSADEYDWDLGQATKWGPWDDATGGQVIFSNGGLGDLIGIRTIKLTAKRSDLSGCEGCDSETTESVIVHPSPDFKGSGGYETAQGSIQGAVAPPEFGGGLVVTFDNVGSKPKAHPDVGFNWDFEGTDEFSNDGLYGDDNSPRPHTYTLRVDEEGEREDESVYTVGLQAETQDLGKPTKERLEYIRVVKSLDDGNFEEQVEGHFPSGPWESFYPNAGGQNLIRPAQDGTAQLDGAMPSAGPPGSKAGWKWLEVSTEGSFATQPPDPLTQEGGLLDFPLPTGEPDPTVRGASGASQWFAYPIDLDGLPIDVLSFDVVFVLGDRFETSVDWGAVDVSFKGVTYNLFYRDADSDDLTETSEIHKDSDNNGASMTVMKKVSVSLKTLFASNIQTGDKVTLWITAGNDEPDLGGGSTPSWVYIDNVRLQKDAGTLDVNFELDEGGPPGIPTCNSEWAFKDKTFDGLEIPDFTTWRWDFGDGNTSFGDGTDDQNPTHKYENPGKFDVTLTVWTPGSAGTKKKKDFIIIKPPVARGEVYGEGPWGTPMEVKFKNLSYDALSYRWDFDDGTTEDVGHAGDVSHTYWVPPGDYPETGNGPVYTVKLTAFSGLYQTGCSNMTTIEVDIRQGFRMVYFNSEDPKHGAGEPLPPDGKGGLVECGQCHGGIASGGAPSFGGQNGRNTWAAATSWYDKLIAPVPTECEPGTPMNWNYVTFGETGDAYREEFKSMLWTLINHNEENPKAPSDNPCNRPSMPANGPPYWNPDHLRYKTLIQWLMGGSQRGDITLIPIK